MLLLKTTLLGNCDQEVLVAQYSRVGSANQSEIKPNTFEAQKNRVNGGEISFRSLRSSVITLIRKVLNTTSFGMAFTYTGTYTR